MAETETSGGIQSGCDQTKLGHVGRGEKKEGIEGNKVQQPENKRYERGG